MPANKHILNFVKNVCDKNYSNAEKDLQNVINEKIKDRVRDTMNQDKK